MIMEIDTLFADAIAGDTAAIEKLATIADHPSEEEDNRTILHIACKDGNTERVKFIATEFADKNLLVKVDKYEQTPLHLAAAGGYAEVVEILIDAARRVWPSSASNDPYSSPSRVEAFLRQADCLGNTALHNALLRSYVDNYLATAELFVNADPDDRHIQNHEGYTPMYIAVLTGNYDVVNMICETCTAPSLDGPEGTTALHYGFSLFDKESRDRDIVMVLMDSAKRSSLLEIVPNNYFRYLFDRTDNRNQTILSLAVQKNHRDAVKFILKEDPAYEHSTSSKYSDLKSLISTASREGYSDIVKILCEKYEAGKTGHACHALLIEAIKGGEKELVHGLLEYDKRLVTYKDDRKWTALHYAAFHKFNQIIDVIISAQKDIYHSHWYKGDVESPLILAAQKKFTSTVILLMKLLPAICGDIDNKGQNILHIAAVQSDKYMIQSILANFPEGWTDRILNAKDHKGNTPLHLLISHGCFFPELIKHNSVDIMAKNKQNWTPSDMLYFQDEVTNDQLKIKILLEDIQAIQATQQKQFWRLNSRAGQINVESSVPQSIRLLKDIEFGLQLNRMMEEEHDQMKKKVKPYRERTTIQIIVTALITTVTFTVGFTMPGGYYQSGEPKEGLVLLSKRKAFEVFMISDASALALSITSLFIYFISSLYDDPHQVSKFDVASTVLNIVSVIAMILTFIAGIYVVLSHSPGLALIVCIICSIFFLSLVFLLIKMMYDWKRSRKIKV